MLAPRDVDRIAEVCAAIANEVADDSGFVPIRNLLMRFGTKLIAQPLLVEGMLASLPQGPESTYDGRRWAVLVDADTYTIGAADLEAESSGQPLPTRLRNTIAHELVHSLAFRPSEFGLQLNARAKSGRSAEADVRAIEAQTERFSPLLLWSEKALGRLLAEKKESLSVSELAKARRNFGISRYVLINRLCLLRPKDAKGFLSAPGLRNLAIGMAQWSDGNIAVLKGWPLFANFDRNIVPSFLWKIIGQDRLPAALIFADEAFTMCGGTNRTTQFVTDAGTEAYPNIEKLEVQISIEDGSKRPGDEFLFVVRVAKSDRVGSTNAAS